MGLMLFMLMIVTAYEVSGNPVECTSQDNYLTKELINTHCLTENLFTVRQINDGISAPSPEIFPGVAAQYRGWENDFVYHCYYRYIPLYLLLQAVFFILPNCLWNYFEKGNLANIIQDLHNTNGQTFDDKRQELIKHSATAIRSMKNTTAYAAKYYLCMMINFLNVVIQFVLTSYFINKGEFFSYGADVISYYVGSDSMVDSQNYKIYSPMHTVFPRSGKCRIYLFGPSGTVQLKDSLCMMPLNALNDKMFLAIWFWFIILACITAVSIAYAVCYYAYHMYYMRKNNAKTGDMFVLSLVKQNVCHITFGRILEELEQQIESKKTDSEQGLNEEAQKNNKEEEKEEVEVVHVQKRLDNISRRNAAAYVV